MSKTGISPLELVVAAVCGVALGVLVLIEPDILDAPFQNARTALFTVGGTVLAAGALVLMLRLRVPVAIRLPVLVIPFLAVNWWLLSPYFVDDVVDEAFSTSIAEQQAPTPDEQARSDADEPDEAAGENTATTAPAAGDPPTTEQAGPALRGAGRFVGLAGHEGTGDAGLFENPDGSHLLRFENFDIENGPDLEVYWMPGADRTSLVDGSIHLGPLKGNVGDQSYALPAGTDVPPGDYTALVWCEAFDVEFVGATIAVGPRSTDEPRE